MDIISEDENASPKIIDGVNSPRKRNRLDSSVRKSWSLMDRKTDYEVLHEMGVSLLEQDDTENHMESSTQHHRPLKRKHNIENLSPNVLNSPRKHKKQCSPIAGPSKARSPKSLEKCKPLTEMQLDTTIIKDYLIEEETPLGQSVTAEYQPGIVTKNTANITPLGQQEEQIFTSRLKWEPSGTDSFTHLSDEVILSVFRWLPKRTLAHCMLVCKRWYQVACDESLWQRLDLGNKSLSKDALGRVLKRKPIIVRLASSEISEWHPTSLEHSRIQYLDLSMATVSTSTLDCLLQRCPALRKLSLENLMVVDSTCEIIGSCSNLETLNLTMAQGVTAEGLDYILKGCENMVSLNISWCALTAATIDHLVENIPAGIQRLNLAGARNATDDMITTLSFRCVRLLELDLSDCSRLSHDTVAALMTLSRLEHLALSRCYLLPAAALAKLNAMASLQYLEVWGMLQSQSIAALKVALPAVQVNQFRFSLRTVENNSVSCSDELLPAPARPPPPATRAERAEARSARRTAVIDARDALKKKLG